MSSSNAELTVGGAWKVICDHSLSLLAKDTGESVLD
jgi:hypothetical protein